MLEQLIAFFLEFANTLFKFCLKLSKTLDLTFMNLFQIFDSVAKFLCISANLSLVVSIGTPDRPPDSRRCYDKCRELSQNLGQPVRQMIKPIEHRLSL